MTASRGCAAAAPDQEQILAFLRQIAERELELDPADIGHMQLDTPIVEGLKLDSVTQVVLLTEIEEHYGFLFELEDRERLETVRDLVEMILSRTGGGKQSPCN
ncbi:MAG: acyl carrier protein [bacterium]